jgi:FkbM family methyltransferase
MLRLAWTLYGMCPRALRRPMAVLAGWAGRFIGLFKNGVTIPAFRLAVDFADNAAFRYWRWGSGYERDLVGCFLRAISLNPQTVVIDVGASYGFFTLSAAAIGRYGLVKKILSFEPSSRSFCALRKSIEFNGMGHLVLLQRKLVGDSDGSAKLFHSGQASTSNRSFETDTGHFKYTHVEELPCTQLDTELDRNAISIPDNFFVMKIDVEGSEYRVLQGARKMLAESRGVIVLFEFFPVGLNEVGASTAHLERALGDLSWDTFDIRDDGVWRTCTGKGDFFAKLQEIFSLRKDTPSYVADCVLSRNMKVAIH